MGTNPNVYGFRYADFASNLAGQPDDPALQNVPWASLDSTVNTDGYNLAPGYVYDLVTRDTAALTFSAATYPGLAELLAASSDGFGPIKGYLDQVDPQAHVNSPADLDNVFPGLTQIYDDLTAGNNPLDEIDPAEVAFKFHVTVSATVLTRPEF